MPRPMDLPELFVLRHGETEWNRARRMQGGLDSLLTAKGEDQARKAEGAAAALFSGGDAPESALGSERVRVCVCACVSVRVC